jgi:hypothetical protein
MSRLASRPQAQSWSDKSHVSDFSYELSIAREPEEIPSLPPQPAFTYLAKKRLESALYAALDKLAPLLPFPGFDGTPLLWLSPPPSSLDNRIGLILVEDDEGSHRFFGSNFIGQPPRASGTAVPDELLSRFLGCKGYIDTTALIAEVLNAVAADWQPAIAQVESEGERFRTMPIYLAVVTRKCTAFYCTSARLEGHPQSKMEIEFYGELAVGKRIS